MNSIDEIYEKLGYAFKNILTDDIVKTGWTKIKVRYDITWDGESESFIGIRMEIYIALENYLMEYLVKNSNCIRNVKKNMELRCR